MNNCANLTDLGGSGREEEKPLSAGAVCKKCCQCNSSVSLSASAHQTKVTVRAGGWEKWPRDLFFK